MKKPFAIRTIEDNLEKHLKMAVDKPERQELIDIEVENAGAVTTDLQKVNTTTIP